MKRIGTFLLIFSSMLVMAPVNSTAQASSPATTPAPVLLGAEFHSGETARYTFSLKTNLKSQVNPIVPPDAVRSFTARQYQVEGEITVMFAATPPGEPLHGTVQFQGLTVKDWVSSAKVADLEARLHQLETTPVTVTTAADGHYVLAEMAASLPQDVYVIDAQNLYTVAQALLVSRILNQPLARGQQRESADFPIPGMIKPGIKLTTLTEYITDVPIAHRPNAEVRLSLNIPYQFHPVSSQSSLSKMLERFHGDGVWTYLLDLDAHQISLLHKTIRSETGYSAESADSNALVRIPEKMITVDKEDEVTARRVTASASPEREADLAAFEKSLAAPPATAAQQAGTAASPGSEVSLADVARRLRAERAAQGQPPPENTPTGSAGAGEGAPAGFKQITSPGGDMTVFVPAQASEAERTSEDVKLSAYLGTPPAVVIFVLHEEKVVHPEPPDENLNGLVQTLSTSPGVRVLGSEKKKINGLPAAVIDTLHTKGNTQLHLRQSYVISEGKAFLTGCGASPADYPKVESVCRTVVESIKAR